ncbi:DUF2243 domain-containing protein [Rhizobium mesosinicum]|uniref:DUF2243 domain-containing protein n=1 Tax=Rhizobium mesosinicum TaxID=335017 RepID=UPI0030843310
MTVVGPSISRHFPFSAGFCLGVGLGGYLDGVVFHQLLQWHHLFSSWYPIISVENLQFNTFWDGVFHSAAYLFIIAGIFILWRAARLIHFKWSTRCLAASMLTGFGVFNLIEGLVDHQLLGIHHVNETVNRSQWLYWDLAFLASGLAMLVIGLLLWRRAHA